MVATCKNVTRPDGTYLIQDDAVEEICEGWLVMPYRSYVYPVLSSDRGRTDITG